MMADGITAEDIVHQQVRVPDWVPPSAYGVRVPKIGIEAKFSLPGVSALSLLGHDLTVPATFSDGYVQDPAFTDLISRIELVGDPAYALQPVVVDHGAQLFQLEDQLEARAFADVVHVRLVGQAQDQHAAALHRPAGEELRSAHPAIRRGLAEICRECRLPRLCGH